MKRRQPPTLRRILIEAAVLFALHATLAHWMAHARLLENLLSPGTESRFALAVIAGFLLLHMFVVLFGAAWTLTRLWLWATRPTTR